MKEVTKILESTTKVRFQDCDPFNHLNNAAYLNYFMNHREDELINNYEIDIYKMGRKEGKSWVVGSNQIAYLRPAFLMEDIVMQSQLLHYSPSKIFVEMRMYNKNKTELKSIMWSTFVHFNLLNQKTEIHSEAFMDLFESIKIPLKETTFEERIKVIKGQTVSI